LRDSTGRLVVVAFPGSLSPAIAKAKKLIRDGAIGRVTSISAFAHQNWKRATVGTWRQNPDISGGGFLFDTGSHMVNTVVDLLGQDIAKVSALLDNSGTPVEINAAVSAFSVDGVGISLAGAGDSVQCCSQLTVCGDAGIMKTGMWGEYLFLKKAKQPDFAAVPYRRSRGPWQTFLKVREGKIKNPCPPEVGLRFAELMDMIYRSNETGRTISRRRRAGGRA
jgi:predicted dehydrogenase